MFNIKYTISVPWIIKALSILLVIYQLWAIFSGVVEPRIRMGVYLAIVLSLVFLIFPISKKYSNSWGDILNITNICCAFLCALIVAYFIIESDRIATRWPQVDSLNIVDILVAILLIVFSIEATRRVLGWPLTIVGIIGLVYLFWGHLVPGTYAHRKFEFVDVLDQIVFTRHALFSSPLDVATTYVFIFILFGQYFGYSGASLFFYKLAKALGSRMVGGQAQIACISSALFGTINGSPSSNTLTTGCFTIPAMIRSGYSPVFASAVEASAGTGGALLPPVMGTAAFLMVEMAGIPYIDIIIAGAIPGMLFYFVLMLTIHLRAKKINLAKAELSEIERAESVWKIILFNSYHFIPLIILVILIIKGFSLSLVGAVAIFTTFLTSWIQKDTRIGIRKIIQGIFDSTRATILIGTACATAGIIVGSLMLTGLGGKIAHLIITFAGSIPFFALFFTAVLCVILGMGMPVPAAYTLTAALAIPSLYPLGFEPLSTHLLVVYFSSLSAITPPVAVAAFAAASISNESPNKIGIQACRLAIAGFILPFIFIYDPTILLIGIQDNLLRGVFHMLCITVGLSALCIFFEGWFIKRLNPLERILIIISSITMLSNINTSFLIYGLLLFVVVIAYIYFKEKMISVT